MNESTEIRVTLPTDLLQEVQRIAAQENWSLDRAMISLAKSGVESQRIAEKELEASYNQFMANPQSVEAGDHLMRSVFGPDGAAKH